MILNKYIAKIFLLRILYTISIVVFAGFLIDGVTNIGQCLEYCSIVYQIKKALFQSIIFADESLFFIVVISAIWFTITISKTNQFVIIATYTKNSFIFLKNVYISIAIVSFFYLFIFYSSAIPYMKNYIHKESYIANIQIETLWINKLKVKDDTTSGNIYMMKNARKYLTGYTADSISIYTIFNGYIKSYTKFNKPFLVRDNAQSVVFIFKENKQTKRNSIGDISINDISTQFGIADRIDISGLIESVFTAFYCDVCSYNQKNTSKIIIVKAMENVVSLLLAISIVFGELPLYHHRASSGVGYKIFRIVSFSMICYTIPEILKIVGNYEINGYIASIALYIAMLCIFMRRLIKHHH